jgi:hypothetical protein
LSKSLARVGKATGMAYLKYFKQNSLNSAITYGMAMALKTKKNLLSSLYRARSLSDVGYLTGIVINEMYIVIFQMAFEKKLFFLYKQSRAHVCNVEIYLKTASNDFAFYTYRSHYSSCLR